MSEKKFFAAANTIDGFVSYYGEIFGKCQRTYIIKGGSGTGKSYFMKQCAEHVKKQSDFNDIEYFHCSFDPSSLDGIVINGNVAIIDGTAPHVYEPTLPGARENIVDLGRFWDSTRLRKSRKILEGLARKKKDCFSRAYAYLCSYGCLDRVRQKILADQVDVARIRSAAAKLFSDIGTEERGESSLRLVGSIGREGVTFFDTYEKLSSDVYRICDKTGGAHMILDGIIAEAGRFGAGICVSYDPLFKGRSNALLVGKTAIVSSVDQEGTAFEDILGAETEEMVKINELQNALIIEATREFKRAADIHFSIEEIYVDAMDFGRKEEFTEEFLRDLVI